MKMYFTVIFTSLFISAILFTSCNSNDSVKQADATTVQSLDSAIATKVNGDDAQFAAAAASGGMMEVEMGKLCADHSKNTEVKKFGVMMVEDHTKADNELTAIAANKNLMLPVVMNDKDQKMYDDMKHKTGSDFDKTYINMMVMGHEEVLKAFQKEANEGKDADISSFATRTIQTIQKHLDAAKAAQKAV